MIVYDSYLHQRIHKVESNTVGSIPRLGYAGLRRAGLSWAALASAGSGWAGLGWAELSWAGLACAGPGWAGLGWAGKVF